MELAAMRVSAVAPNAYWISFFIVRIVEKGQEEGDPKKSPSTALRV
jgi:hypothetical protein